MRPSDKTNDLPAKLYVRRPFAMADTNLKIGDEFDQGLVPERRLRQLWDQRKLGTKAELEIDQARYAARQGVVAAAKQSMDKPQPEPIEEPVTAEDYDL